jgi:hypothetical protein
MTAKTTKYTREWLVEAIKLSLSSLKRGEDEVVRMDSVELNVRSMDLDSDRKGWFVVIPSVSDERIKMNVDDGVDKFAVVPGRPLMADVSVYYRVADGVRTANRCVMHAVR